MIQSSHRFGLLFGRQICLNPVWLGGCCLRLRWRTAIGRSGSLRSLSRPTSKLESDSQIWAWLNHEVCWWMIIPSLGYFCVYDYRVPRQVVCTLIHTVVRNRPWKKLFDSVLFFISVIKFQTYLSFRCPTVSVTPAIKRTMLWSCWWTRGRRWTAGTPPLATVPSISPWKGIPCAKWRNCCHSRSQWIWETSTDWPPWCWVPAGGTVTLSTDYLRPAPISTPFVIFIKIWIRLTVRRRTYIFRR